LQFGKFVERLRRIAPSFPFFARDGWQNLPLGFADGGDHFVRGFPVSFTSMSSPHGALKSFGLRRTGG